MGPEISIPRFKECSAHPSPGLTLHILEYLVKCDKDIIYLRQKTYFQVLLCFNFCGQRELKRPWKVYSVNDTIKCKKWLNFPFEHFTLPYPTFHSTLKMELMMSAFSFCCSQCDAKQASQHSQWRNQPWPGTRHSPYIIFIPPPYFILKFTVRIPWTFRETADKVVN